MGAFHVIFVRKSVDCAPIPKKVNQKNG